MHSTDDDSQIDFSAETKRDAFLAVQFNSLRAEIELQIVERRKVESQTFIGIALMYAWLFSRDPALSGFSLAASLSLPVILGLLGLLRWIGIMSRIMALASYIERIECSIIGETGGWERHLRRLRSAKPILGHIEGIAEGMAWTILIAVSLGILVYQLV